MGLLDSVGQLIADRLVLEAKGSLYDTRLVFPPRGAVSNLEYLLTAKLQLNRVDDQPEICTKLGARKKCRPWTDEEWREFISSVSGIAKYWNRKLWIKLPDDFNSLNRKAENGEFRPYLCCMVKVEVIPTFLGVGIGDHSSIDVVHAADDETKNVFPSNSHLWSDRDLKATDRIRLGGHKFTQVTAAHELGHLIGLPHVGVTKDYEECREEHPNICYGKTVEDRSSIMGTGMRIRETEAKPWVDHLDKHFPGRTKDEFTVKVGNNLNSLKPIKV